MSCTSKEETLKNKRDEVMQIHDEAMAKMEMDITEYELNQIMEQHDYLKNDVITFPEFKKIFS